MLNKKWEDMSDAEKARVRKEEQEKFSRMQPIAASTNVIHADTAAAARKMAIEYWKKNYPNGVTINTIVGDVQIDVQSIKSSLFHGLIQRKLDVIPTLQKGVERAAYLCALGDFDGKESKNHYFLYKVDIDSEENLVLCRVKENFGKKRLYIHEVIPAMEFVHIAQKSDALQSQPADKSHLQLRGITLYRDMITDFMQGVNGEFYPLQKEEKNMPDQKAAPELPNAETEELFSDNELSVDEMEEYHK